MGGIRWRSALVAVVIATCGFSSQAGAWSRFEHLRQQDARVAAVAYRLSLSGKALCPRAPTPQPGFILHSLAQYAPADRAAAAASYGLGSSIGVMAVVAGSPAEQAGLSANDQLISVNGTPLDLAEDTAPGLSPAERAGGIIAAALVKGVITLRVSGASGERDVRFGAAPGCPAQVALVTDTNVNAWADGERVVITTGILEQCHSDDELALVIAHELAHNILRHRQRLGAAGAGRLMAGSGAGSAKMRKTEEEADLFAVNMTGSAGYDLGKSLPFLTRLLEADRGGSDTATTHPDSAQRLALLRAAIAEFGAAAAAR